MTLPFKPRQRRYKIWSPKNCPDCRGEGKRPINGWKDSITPNPGGFKKCHCIRVVDRWAPKKEKREMFDGKMAALGADA